MSFAFGIGIGTQNNQGEWLEVYNLLHEMRATGVISPDTMRPHHKSMYKAAKRELGMVKLRTSTKKYTKAGKRKKWVPPVAGKKKKAGAR